MLVCINEWNESLALSLKYICLSVLMCIYISRHMHQNIFSFFCCYLVFVCVHMHVFVQMSSMLILGVRQCFSVLV